MQKCASACVCMCDSLLLLRKMKRSAWPGAQREEVERDSQKVEREREREREREKCTCSLNEGSCERDTKEERQSVVGCRSTSITVSPHCAG